MLKVKIPEQPAEQLWDYDNEMFVYTKPVKACELTLEHSLLSVSKWESIWCKAFLAEKDHTVEEMLSYIECMIVSPQNVDQELIKRIPQSEFERIDKYINSPATATIINGEIGGKKSSEFTSSEMIYYWMIAMNIPIECQKWHLNRLLTLIKVCEIKNDPKGQKKMSANEIRADYDKLNEMRKKKYHTKG